jgi:WD40 repeat protein
VTSCGIVLIFTSLQSNKALREKSLDVLLTDLERLLLANSVPVIASALHIYHSAVVTMPMCQLWDVNAQHCVGIPVMLSPRPPCWDQRLRILGRHEASVRCVACSPDGQYVVSSSDDRTVRVWDAKTGKQEHIMRGHEGIVTSAEFSPNGQMIVSGSADCTVRVWSSATGMQQRVMNGHDKGVRLCTFSPDNRYIVSGSSDYTLRLWDVTTGIQQCVMNGHAGRVNSVTFSRDGKLVVSSSNDYTIRIWDTVTGTQYGTICTDGLGEVRSVAFFVDTGRIISVSCDSDRDYTICTWDLRVTTGPEPLYMWGHEDTINSVVISGDNRFMVSGSSDCTIELFSFGDSRLTTLNLHESSVNSVAVSPDNQSIISGSDDCTVLVWNISEGARQHVISNHEGQATIIAFSPTGQLVVAGFCDGMIRIWNVATGTQQHIMIGHKCSIHSVAFSPDGNSIASICADEDIRVWDAATGAQRHVFSCNEPSNSVAFSFDNQHVVSAWTWIGLGELIRDMSDEEDMADPFPRANTQPLIAHSLNRRTRPGARALVWNASTGAKLDRETATHEHIVAATLRLVRSVPDTPYELDNDGWVSYRVARGVQKLLCWLPGERRGNIIASHGQKLCIGASSGAITILDFSNVAYL